MDRLETAIEAAADLLPGQGPISIFVHHNPLHAFEHLPFEKAAVEAGRRLGCEPFLGEDAYRRELARGRISVRDIEAILAEELGPRAGEPVAGPVSRSELRRHLVVHGFPDVREHALAWLLDSTGALSRFRRDLPIDVRAAVLPDPDAVTEEEEERLVRELWRSCLGAARRCARPQTATGPMTRRHRDLLLEAGGVDLDRWIHPLLIRFVSSYLDQGFAHWPMPGRERGMYTCFLDTYSATWLRLGEPWARGLPALLASERAEGRDGASSLRGSLGALGVPEEEWEEVLAAEALALRGWAGMVRQIERRPDRVPGHAVPARLVDFLAVRLLLTRAAAAHAARSEDLGEAPLATVRASLAERARPERAPANAARAWPLFHGAQLCGLDAAGIDALSDRSVATLMGELTALDGTERRRILHLAYERNLRHRLFDALAQHRPPPAPDPPSFQAVFCIDEREESFRRHLEEVEPGVETFGAAGFFGVAMYFQGATDARPRPLCPVSVRPDHYVEEERPAGGHRFSWHALQREASALVDKNVHIASRTLVRGTVVMATVGVVWVVPRVLRVLFPWLGRHLARMGAPASAATPGRLRLERQPSPPPLGAHFGFTVHEMADIVRRQLEELGIVGRISPLVFVVGHGSTSLNNPHESAHDCGACGGGQGGPNARAFAAMANDPRVRTTLASAGLEVPEGTWFVGAFRNTASNEVEFFDEESVPASLADRLRRARRAFAVARAREAHERCRRFEAFPAWLSPRLALLHVEGRSADLAQPRPEYGHATNAFCVVGRRSRTRALFLDRRAFLISYDPTRDSDGRVLARLLAAVVPVVAGISLEYLFGYVDPTGYGSGTKLPHNVTGLLGVMDGAQSDLRTGLPWQMLEIHEPVRLSVVVEAREQVLGRILEEDTSLRRLVANRWIFLACLDPDSGRILQADGSGFREYAPERPLRRARGDSASYYRGRRGSLPLAGLSPRPGRQRTA